ncbi:hypothetical protein [Elizabethkingia anophelis]|uniref:hypothetical protein n=1 Tax=Elizabethkingia anophelis TaxID=1117645 RepID=UPI003892AEC4
MACIDNYEILKGSEHEKKLLSAIKRIEKATNEISQMGYRIYISAHGNLNVMNVDDVPYEYGPDFHQKQIVASGNMESTDCGDW